MSAQLRKDHASGRWVVVGTQQPDQFFPGIEKGMEAKNAKECPYCQGNESSLPDEIWAVREGGAWQVRVVRSRESWVGPEGDVGRQGVGMYDVMNNVGSHELIIETPRHEKNLCNLPPAQIEKVLGVYQRRISELGKDARMRYAMLFKNQRRKTPERFGHSHSQIVALPTTPKVVKDELKNCRDYYNYKERCLFCDMLRQELSEKTRIVDENESYLAFTPFASRFPFEIWVMPKQHQSDFTQAKPLAQLAQILQSVLGRISHCLGDPSLHMMLHTLPYLRPFPGYWTTVHKDFHWHWEITPHMGEVTGFEWGTGFHIVPLTPEQCAEILRSRRVVVEAADSRK